jgi:hypothetical protein
MPPTIFKTLPIAPLLALALTVVPLARAATTETLTSPTLEIALNSSPFSHRVMERSTGEVLVSQTGGTTLEATTSQSETSHQEWHKTTRTDPTTPSTLLHKTHDSLPGWHEADVARRRKPVLIRMEEFLAAIPRQKEK